MSHTLHVYPFSRLFVMSALVFGAGNLALGASGLRGEYFNNNGLLGTPTLVRTDATVNVDWDNHTPATGVSGDRFSIRWTGKVQAPAAGAYRFATSSDAGIRVWLNSTLIIDAWASHSTRTDRSNLIN